MYSPTAHEVGTHAVPLQRQNEMPAGGMALHVRADGVGAAAAVVTVDGTGAAGVAVTVIVGVAVGGAGWVVPGGCAVMDVAVVDVAVVDGAAVGEPGRRLGRDAAPRAL